MKSKPNRNVVKEATSRDGVLDAVKLMNIISPKGRRKSPRSVAAAQVSKLPRQQTLDDFEFSLGSKQTLQGALDELSASEIDDMLRAMDTGEGVDVRSGRNKMAFDTMIRKQGVSPAIKSAAAKDLAKALTKGAKQYKTHRLRQGLTKDDDGGDIVL